MDDRGWDLPPDDDYDDDDDDPNEPGNRDYDLSEEHGYTWEPSRPGSPIPTGWLAVVSVVAIISLVLPTIIFILHYT
jgi:hypothetical protein